MSGMGGLGGLAPPDADKAAPKAKVKPAPVPAVQWSAGWQRAALVWLLLMAAWLAAAWQTGESMVGIWWRSETFTHCFLVAPISAWLVWRQRHVLGAMEPRPWWPALLPIAALVVARWMAELAAVNAVAQFALVAVIVLLVPLVFGLAVARAITFPLAFLFFAVPIGEFLTPVLMQYTADFTVAALRMTGIPVHREGLQFVIPTGVWSVVEACSGVRYLMASLMVGSLFAYLNYRSPRRRWAFVAVSAIVPIFANWLRAYMIVMLGHLSGNKLAAGVDHLIYGWVFFGIVIMAMFWIGMRWADAPHEPPRPQRDAALAGTPTARWTLPGALALLLLAGPALLQAVMIPPVEDAQVRLGQARGLAAGWEAAEEPAALWQPVYPGAAAQSREVFRKGGQVVGLHVAHYRQQGEDRKLVSSVNQFVASGDPFWHATGRHADSLPTDTGAVTAQGVELTPRRPGTTQEAARLHVWRLYLIDGQWVADDRRAKIAGALQRMRGHGDDGQALLLYVPGDDHARAAQAASAFLNDNAAALRTWLAAVTPAPRRGAP